MATFMISTTQAARLLGVTPGRVVQHIAAGLLPAQKIGNSWVLDPADVAAFQPRPTGYPKGRKRK
jgi:excisionase family DNA binding protein